MKQIGKYAILGTIGGSIYTCIELLFRGYSHWSMFYLAFIAFILMGLWNEVFSWETPLWKQVLLSGITTTFLEFITGCVMNLWFKWNVWNYTYLDILGQVSLPFFFVWCGLSLVGIVLDDWLRYILFHEERPHYKLF